MPRKRPPHTETWRDRHGKVRIYFRRAKGPRIALPGEVGSAEFEAAYAAALAGTLEPKKAKPEPLQPGTIASLIASYMTSASYRSLRATTKKGYGSRIETLRTKHGHRTVSGLSRERIVSGILQPYADRPGATIALLKMLRILIRHAIDIGWLKHDPSLGIKRPKSQEIRAWSEAEIRRFEAKWPIGSKERLAFALMLYTGQRRSDVHRMAWSDVSGPAIRVVQQKTRERLTIPIHAELRKVLDAASRDHRCIVSTEAGNPFTVSGFGNFMRAAIEAAGHPLDCQPHGLRKAAGRRLAEAGCTAREIMAVLGHRTLAEAERYTREADKARLAVAAIAKLEKAEADEKSQTTPEKFGGNRRKPSKISAVSDGMALPRERRKRRPRKALDTGLGEEPPDDPQREFSALPNPEGEP